MRATITLREGLPEEDMLWLSQVGEEMAVTPGTTIIQQGIRPNGIFVVLRGRFDVAVDTFADQPLAKLGAGELIGEISFLEGSPASATIAAIEESAVLVVDNQLLNERICEDSAFAARIYRAFALIAERRLRNRVDHLAFLVEIGSSPRNRHGIGIPALDW